MRGASGAVAGVPLTYAVHALFPAALCAVTRKRYVRPLSRSEKVVASWVDGTVR